MLHTLARVQVDTNLSLDGCDSPGSLLNCPGFRSIPRKRGSRIHRLLIRDFNGA